MTIQNSQHVHIVIL